VPSCPNNSAADAVGRVRHGAEIPVWGDDYAKWAKIHLGLAEVDRVARRGDQRDNVGAAIRHTNKFPARGDGYAKWVYQFAGRTDRGRDRVGGSSDRRDSGRGRPAAKPGASTAAGRNLILEPPPALQCGRLATLTA
jgi:hypothetical protein